MGLRAGVKKTKDEGNHDDDHDVGEEDEDEDDDGSDDDGHNPNGGDDDDDDDAPCELRCRCTPHTAPACSAEAAGSPPAHVPNKRAMKNRSRPA